MPLPAAVGTGIAIVDTVMKAIGHFIPDPTLKQQIEEKLRSDLLTWDASQNTVNAAEATNNSLFVAGWRPAIGWCCALALFYSYLFVPIASWIIAVSGNKVPFFPALDQDIWALMFGMLGMGGLRSWEKYKGIAK